MTPAGEKKPNNTLRVESAGHNSLLQRGEIVLTCTILSQEESKQEPVGDKKFHGMFVEGELLRRWLLCVCFLGSHSCALSV